MADQLNKEEYRLPRHRELFSKFLKSLARLRGSLKSRGLTATMLLAIQSLRSLFWLDRQVMMFDIRTVDPYRKTDVDSNVELRELKTEDHEELLHFSMHFDSRELQRRLRRGDVCTIAKMDGRIVFYGWGSVGKVYVSMLGRYMDRGPDRVYFHNTYTDPSCRNRSILPAFMGRMHDYGLKNGYPGGYTLVDIELGLPINAYMKLTGASRVALIHYRRRFGIKSYTHREISREEAIELSRRRRKEGLIHQTHR